MKYSKKAVCIFCAACIALVSASCFVRGESALASVADPGTDKAEDNVSEGGFTREDFRAGAALSGAFAGVDEAGVDMAGDMPVKEADTPYGPGISNGEPEDGEEPRDVGASGIIVNENIDALDEDMPEDYEDEYGSGGEDEHITMEEILEGSVPEGDMDGEVTPEGEAKRSRPAADYVVPEDVVFSADDWRLILINKQHPIPEDYSFVRGTIKGSMECDERIIEDLMDMLQAARDDGISLVIVSPYRDMNRQVYLFNRKVSRYMGSGMSYLEAYRLASQAVTVPGASEHQVGLALDIVSNNYTSLSSGFGETAAGQWLADHSCEFGFTIRYPAGKEYITSIEYEPWHFRYVGRDAATIMRDEGLCLEEFVDKYI